MLLFGVFYTLTTRRVVTQKVITYYFFILLIENELKRLADAFLTDSHLNFGTGEVLCALFQSVQKNEFFKIIKVVEGNIYHVSYFLKA